MTGPRPGTCAFMIHNLGTAAHRTPTTPSTSESTTAPRDIHAHRSTAPLQRSAQASQNTAPPVSHSPPDGRRCARHQLMRHRRRRVTTGHARPHSGRETKANGGQQRQQDASERHGQAKERKVLLGQYGEGLRKMRGEATRKVFFFVIP